MEPMTVFWLITGFIIGQVSYEMIKIYRKGRILKKSKACTECNRIMKYEYYYSGLWSYLLHFMWWGIKPNTYYMCDNGHSEWIRKEAKKDE